VDDEAGFTEMVRIALRRYDVREENNPARAVETAREFRPELILLDVVMPEVDGGDVAAQLKADPELAGVPVIFLTAIVSPRETEGGRVCGGYPFIAKPLSPEKLIEMIEAHLPRWTPANTP